MKISKLLTALVIVLSLSAVSFNSAFAGPGQPGVPWSSGNGQGASVSHLSTSYVGSIGGTWSLSEVKVINKNKSVENFSGTISDLSTLPAGSYTTDASGVFYLNGQGYAWNSDFNLAQAKSVTFTVTDNGDGTGTITGTATY